MDKETKYLFVAHAERNALDNAPLSVEGCTLYSPLLPCNECAKAIIQSGIKEVVFAEDKYHQSISTQAAKKLFTLAGVKMTHYQGRIPHIRYE
jgi:dCMP deaminase